MSHLLNGKKGEITTFTLAILVFVAALLLGQNVQLDKLNAISGYAIGSWSQVFDDVIDSSYIYSLAEYNGKLYAGSGEYGKVYVTSDGSAWSTSLSPVGNLKRINALAVYNDGTGNKLYAGSYQLPPTDRGIIYEYNGNTWSVSSGADAIGTQFLSLAVYNGKLYAGTATNGRIWEKNGINPWSDTFISLGSYVFSLAVYNGKLYAGTYPGGKIWVYDGSTWAEDLGFSAFGQQRVYSLAVYNNRLYAGTNPNGITYVYNGATWSTSRDFGATDIRALGAYGNRLYAGPGGAAGNGDIWAYDGSAWQLDFGTTEWGILSFAEYRGRFYAGSYPTGTIYEYTAICTDADNDGYGASGTPLAACTDSTTLADCNDANSLERPGQTWYKDSDNDGYSDGTSQITCARPAGYRTNCNKWRL